jgi:thiol-disulfide isomerase/thioredoxin
MTMLAVLSSCARSCGVVFSTPYWAGVLLLIMGSVPGAYAQSVSVDSASASSLRLEQGLNLPYHAPDLVGIDGWLNSSPLTMQSLLGKVVLVDFWTYSCFNCIHTLPHIVSWDKKYRHDGLVVIGVQSPEFDVEKNVNNVKAALTRYGITYPVALDNQLATWGNYQNHYWPAYYLINRQGKVVYTHFGEGDYDVTENNIRYLLSQAK